MPGTKETNRKKQQEFQERMSQTHKPLKLWIPLEDVPKLEEIAKANDWISETGRNAGQPNLKRTACEMMRRGINETLKETEEEKNQQ